MKKLSISQLVNKQITRQIDPPPLPCPTALPESLSNLLILSFPNFPFSVATFPLWRQPATAGYMPRESGECDKGEVCLLFQLVPFGGSGAYRINDSPHSPFSFTLPPSAYGLRPIASFSFFRLETPFLTFLALLYYSMNQQLIYPSYTNRPRFV